MVFANDERIDHRSKLDGVKIVPASWPMVDRAYWQVVWLP
jgi:hypothetical protein